MAFNARVTKISAIIQVVLGGFCVVFGAADVVMYNYSFPSMIGMAIWMGVWIIVTGIIGIVASSRGNNPIQALLGTFMGFSISCTILAGILMICYGISLVYGYYSPARLAVTVMIFLFGACEFGISLWSAICCCMGANCCRPESQTAPQMVFIVSPGAGGMPVVASGAGGIPVAIQGGGQSAFPVGGTQVVQGQVVSPMEFQGVASSPGAPPAYTNQTTDQDNTRLIKL